MRQKELNLEAASKYMTDLRNKYRDVSVLSINSNVLDEDSEREVDFKSRFGSLDLK